MSTPPLDPWTNGTPAYRRTLLLGMVSTFLGVVCVVLAAVAVGPDLEPTLRGLGLGLIGLGIISHLIAILLRKRQAKQIIQARADQSKKRGR
ncbi:hypothetical protein Q7C18_05640 [Nesterenkonia sp. CL21]|uniref:hypothetical protein n=1 Tax=Nesterenkonia sp. CL21 TaxID=3064894 RepID=UPI00287976F1|nr:hypothetical protein [Nesterenkonia sp. CL21]MDS2172173.1 hypothetical protein [Nesterenkonia sp. CL21]